VSAAAAGNDALVVDVSELPHTPLDHRALVWWGTLGMLLIESMAFALAIATYFYLRMVATQWPPAPTPQPRLLFPVLNLAVLLLSLIPAIWADKAAEKKDAAGVRKALALSLLFGLVFLAGRDFEFRALACMWNSHAYGSVTWTILGLHTFHVVASLIETAIILAVFLTREPHNQQFLDARLDGVYWYFVVSAWVPLWLVVFIVPRIL
jgi:cytochrome c oxidase subunit III